ncbi:sigma 54-interacting transcriptional regulator [Brevibacillus ruminantium]|uniref:Sigma 54-interacting transcriptional regulator n=1 Tax=Brevibacillus ruminantium TaxID=2950604 RepID=A0ABY4WJ26_9BACL|nr:sigma 54-interacting transcriptional regulator [Brevibacillus ruminantium]USG67123.1 sigma 54-interacting transcriptional regulator [Brevibacillus ruminantium]
MDKRLIMIGIQEENLMIITEQIKHIIGDFIKIKPVTIKDVYYGLIGRNDVVLLSGEVLREIVQPFLHEECICMVANREVNIVNLKELMGLPAGQHILVVNDYYSDTLQTVSSLETILPEHRYYPYFLNQPLPKKIDFVVTPGEKDIVPKALQTVIDIGPRVISFSTLEQIVTLFSIEVSHSLIMNRYIKSLVSISRDSTKRGTSNFEDQNQKRTIAQFVTHSPLMQETVEIAGKIAITPYPIHIEGETGTGKRLMAEAIHNQSYFRKGPFFTYNCAEKSEEQLAVELFGKEEEGISVQGIVEATNGGTLFLQNMDCLSNSLQARLLHLLESKEIQRVHGEGAVPVQLRLITSTSKRLSKLLEAGKVRIDLYSYISSYIVRLPTLSERKEDLELLIETFKRQLKKEELHFSKEVLAVFSTYSWPGNVRELFNVVSYCACMDTTQIELRSLPLYFRGHDALDEQRASELDVDSIVAKIEEHGFLSESIGILEILKDGKEQQLSYGRSRLKTLLEGKGIQLTDQQLRLRLEILNHLKLLLVRQGRAGTTISTKGELFLQQVTGSLVSQ